ncbi:LegC family aminotransferase [Maribellus maritimus]|uniref:LegC family aminotransferase n=1 Tax=Maribellus maritimus TaxID=2870838 RepID=UPI001EEB3B20|nr:LegC family aminotransferase [Maribellus maritimus]MCG6191213.1 LegC family aminotransferase [Maribellus maritimus]
MNRFAEIVKFIRQTFNQPEGFIPLHAPVFNGNEKKYIEECINSTFVSSVGMFVDRFEEDMANFTGAKKAVVCVNGTNALHLALMLAGVKQNDEVITQPLTFIATANAISYCGAQPVFIDVDRDRLGLSPQALQNFLDKNTTRKGDGCYNNLSKRKISALVPMHTFGHPCRIDEIAKICEQYHIELVEDAAESLGSYFNKRHTGTFGKIGVLSFNGNKIITTGGGGMLLFDDEESAKKAKHITTQAKVPHAWEFVHDAIGYNYRMPNINAALGLAQLEQLSGFLKIKRELAERYQSFFSGKNIQFIKEPENSHSNYWLNAILLKDRKERDEFLKYTNQNGIMTRPVWELMNRLPMFRDSQCGNIKNAEWIADRLVNIPSSATI